MHNWEYSSDQRLMKNLTVNELVVASIDKFDFQHTNEGNKQLVKWVALGRFLNVWREKSQTSLLQQPPDNCPSWRIPSVEGLDGSNSS